MGTRRFAQKPGEKELFDEPGMRTIKKTLQEINAGVEKAVEAQETKICRIEMPQNFPAVLKQIDTEIHLAMLKIGKEVRK